MFSHFAYKYKSTVAHLEWRQTLFAVHLQSSYRLQLLDRIVSHQHICTKCIFRALSTDIRKKRVTSVAICYPLEEGKITVVCSF